MYEFSHTVSRQDSQHFEAMIHRSLHGPAIIRLAIFGLLIPYGAAALTASFGRLYFVFSVPGQHVIFSDVLVVTLISIVTYIALRDVGQYLWHRYILPPMSISGPEKTLINENGVQTTSQTGVHFSNWSGVIDITTSKHGVLIRSGIYLGWFLPNRIFADETEKLAVIEFGQSSMRDTRK